MDLSLREAATLLGRPPRTLRDQLARGDLRGSKVKGAWVIPSDALPLTERQRRALQARAAEIRAAMEDVLPSRAATERTSRRRSLADVEAFHRGTALLRQLRAEGEPWGAAAGELEEALLLLAEANAQYDRDLKVDGLRAARARLGRAAALVLMAADDPPAAPVPDWLRVLEGEVLPLLAGLSRWAERLPRRSR
jgi:hypothetical protein